jgi:hypothetical protein
MAALERARAQSEQRLDELHREMQPVPAARILAEVEEVSRSIPPLAEWSKWYDANNIWFGRLRAVIKAWDPVEAVFFDGTLTLAMNGNQFSQRDVIQTLHKARFSLRMKVGVPETVAIEQGAVYDYFDEVRKIIATAAQDVLFIDPYLDAEFVSKYLGLIREGVSIRLLSYEYIQKSLLPAVRQWNQQHGAAVQIRSDRNLHDRYVIIDGTDIYLSGASFKDGGKRAGTVISQLRDSAGAVIGQYEQQWSLAKAEI